MEKDKRNPQICLSTIVYKSVDNVDNYLFTSEFPIESTFPAPIVINRSFFLQFSKIKFFDVIKFLNIVYIYIIISHAVYDIFGAYDASIFFSGSIDVSDDHVVTEA